ncbi:beta-propeller fold lactonase family protein, partial [Candidatus Desantisbacteria bacterium]|nr:beta-propeller fold lactonase family protein [Candidatus Desantisbacteria bacterium]
MRSCLFSEKGIFHLRGIFILFVFILLCISGCGKKSDTNYKAQKEQALAVFPVKISIKWPQKVQSKKERRFSRIPNTAQSIKINVRGTNIKDLIELIVNRNQDQGISEVELQIPAGLTHFEVNAFSQFNASGINLAYGEVIYNILPGIINDVKITLDGTPQSISIFPENARIIIGDTCQFTANIYDADGFALPQDSIVWSQDNSSIAILDSAGKATGTSEGISHITAHTGDLSAQAQLEVVDLRPVENFSAFPGNKQVTLHWTKDDGTVSFSIYSSNTPAVLISDANLLTSLSDSTYVHENLTNGNMYYYRIVSINGNLNKENLEEINACPSDIFLYNVCADSDVIEEFSADINTGDLSKIGEIFTFANSDYNIDKNMAVCLSKKMLYVSDYESSKIYEYSINENSGNLLYLAEIKTGTKPRDMKIDPSENFLYTANYNDNTIGYYIISDNGILLWQKDISTDDGPNSIAIDPLSSFMCVANFKSPYLMDKYALADGEPEYQNEINCMKNITSLFFLPTGSYIYAASPSESSIAVYIVENNNLVDKWSFSTGYKPSSIAISPQSKFLYSASYGSDSISSYTIDNNTGALSLTETVSSGDGPQDIAVTSDSKFLYAANSLENTISIYQIDPETGSLAFLKKINTKIKPAALCIFSHAEETQV